MRPIDIARKLDVSTTMLRTYEKLDVVPVVKRSDTGYRYFTDEHLAYFTCIRQMQKGFSFTFTSKVMKRLLANDVTGARWLITEAQAKLYDEMKIINTVQALLHDYKALNNSDLLTTHEVSQLTDIPVSTIRYWDKQGLLNAQRSAHNYRRFNQQDVKKVLTLYTLKLSRYFKGNRHSIDWLKESLQSYTEQKMILALTEDVKAHLYTINGLQQEGVLAFLTLAHSLEKKDE